MEPLQSGVLPPLEQLVSCCKMHVYSASLGDDCRHYQKSLMVALILEVLKVWEYLAPAWKHFDYSQRTHDQDEHQVAQLVVSGVVDSEAAMLPVQPMRSDSAALKLLIY